MCLICRDCGKKGNWIIYSIKPWLYLDTAWGVTPAIQKFRLWWQLRIQNSFICIFRLLSTRPFDFQTSFLDFTRRPKNKVNILKNKLKTYRNLLNLDKKFPSPIELSVIFFIAQFLRYRYPQCTFRQNSANDPFKWTLQILLWMLVRIFYSLVVKFEYWAHWAST